jgi:hypothetical protein
MSEQKRTILRKLTEALMRHNAHMIPSHRSVWAEAMQSEAAHIEDELTALVWAIGCVLAVYWERLTSHSPQLATPHSILKGNIMQTQQMNRISSKILLCLSLIALIPVGVPFIHLAVGHPMALPHDEGALAHIFQLAVVLSGLTLLFCLATTNWKHPAEGLRALAIPVVALALALTGVRLMHL